MHHEVRPLVPMEWLSTEPLQQIASIVCLQHIMDRVFWFGGKDALGDGQEEDVMVAEDDLGRRAERFEKPQHAQRCGTAVDEISDAPKPIGRRIETDILQQAIERSRTTLDIADGVGGHE